MKSNYLHTFTVSIATGSFSKAAESLNVTQSAVSRRIQHLEEQ
ncbi:MAG TPA: LysR family transcriptional regulator [Desulfuromonadales bacterium]|nr:LysR family transcriptional regulator [Desulfuromonadales bacterium]